MAVENYFGVGPRLINGKFRRVRSMTMLKWAMETRRRGLMGSITGYLLHPRRPSTFWRVTYERRQKDNKRFLEFPLPNIR
jgi:hypothetical protein